MLFDFGLVSDMISKDREDDGVDQSTDSHLPPVKLGQVQSQIEPDVASMSRPSPVGNAVPGDKTSLETREEGKDNCDSVHSLLGRPFNGDLIASQVYLCITCGLELEDANSLRRHELHCCALDNSTSLPGATMSLDEAEGFRKLVCEICRAYFSETDQLQEHKLLHLNTSNVCYLCDTFFANRYLLARHVVCQHSERFGVKQNEEGVHEPYTCAICILRFSTLIALQAHEDSHGVTEKTPTCRICSVSNSSHQALQSHLKSNLHAEMKLQLQNLFTCIDCSTVFHCRDAYAMHMMMRAKDESCKKADKVRVQIDEEVKGTPSIVIVKEEPPDSVPSSDCAHGTSSTSHPSRVDTSTPLVSHQTKLDSPTASNAQVCPGCGMLCYDSNHLLSHLRMCGSVLNPQTNSDWGQSQNGLVFKWAVNKTYSLHLPTAMSRKEKRCSYCRKSFMDQDDLAMHVMSDHSREITDTDRTSSPPTNSRGRQSSERNGECPLIVYSPHSVAVLGSSDHGVSPIPSLGLSHHVVSQENGASPQPTDSAGTEKARGTDLPPSRKSPTFSQASPPECRPTGPHDKFTDENYAGKKRRRGRSPSAAFSPNRNSRDNRPRSAESSCPSDGESGIKRRHLSTPPGVCSGITITPLDLSQGFRDVESSESGQGQGRPISDNIKREMTVDDEGLGRQAVLDEIPISPTHSCRSQDSDTRKAEGSLKISPPGEVPTDVVDNSSLDEEQEPPLIQLLLDNRKNLFQCPHCKIVYMDRTLYCLHMGLHNVNNPWQCNMCGKAFQSVHQFSSHVLHF